MRKKSYQSLPTAMRMDFALPPQNRKKQNKGSVLLFCLGVLAILSLLGATLLSIAHSENREVRSFMANTRAQLAAESGIEDAIAKLLTYDGDPRQLQSRIQTVPGNTPGIDLRMKDILQASFPAFDLDGNSYRETSGYISETFHQYGESYGLKVQQTQNRLNLNDTNGPWNMDTEPNADQISPDQNYQLWPNHLQSTGGKDPDWVYYGDPDWNPEKGQGNKPYPKAPGRLSIIFGELLYILFGDDGLGLTWSNDRTWALSCAHELFTTRRRLTDEKFQTMEQVREALVKPGKLSPAQFNIFKSYVTLHSWQDQSVIRPTFTWTISRPSTHMEFWPQETPMTILYIIVQPDPPGLPGRPTFGSVYNGNNNAEDIYLYSDMQTKHFEMEPRCPIDLNNAPLEMLQALIRPVNGWYLKEAPAAGEPDTAENWSVPKSTPVTSSILSSVSSYGYHPWFILGNSHVLTDPNPSIGAGTGSNSITREAATVVSDNQFYYYDEASKLYYYSTVDSAGVPVQQFEAVKKYNRFGRLMQTSLTTASLDTVIPDNLAKALYDRIHNQDWDGDGAPDFHPFSTWEEFEDFIHDQADQDGNNDIPGFDDYMADAIIANFNPNSRINDYNPNKTNHLHTDKSQLIGYSTEFCFIPMGHYEITSLGKSLDNAGKPGAEASVQATVKVLDYLKITTQSQFMEGYDPKDDAKQSSRFFSPSSSYSAGLNFNGGVLDSSYTGNSLQSYPEPELGDANTNYIGQSVYDGYLALSINKPLRNDLYTLPDVVWFYGYFPGTLNAGWVFPGYNGSLVGDTSTSQWVADNYRQIRTIYMANTKIWAPDHSDQIPANYPEARRLTRSTKEYFETYSQYYSTSAGREADALPGCLCPDGAFSCAGSSLKYLSESFGEPTTQGRQGSLGFWVKPGFDVAHANRLRQFFTMAPKNISVESVGPEQYMRDYAGSSGISATAIFSGIGNYAMSQDFSFYYFAHGSPDPNAQMSDDTMPVYSSTQGADCFSTRSCFLQTRDHDMSLTLLLAASGIEHDHGTLGIGTNAANQSWRAPGSNNPALWRQYNLETRQWNRVEFSWDFTKDISDPATFYFCMSLNGQAIEQYRNWHNMLSPIMNLHILPGGNPNYIRFGESSSAPFRNDVADSTFDLITGSPKVFGDPMLIEEYGFGRYYSEDDAVYVSPDIDPFKALGSKASSLTLNTMYWTLYWPKTADNSKAADHPRFNDNRGTFCDQYEEACSLVKMPGDSYPEDPMYLNGLWSRSWIPISADFFDPFTNSWYYGDNGVAKIKMPNYAGGSQDAAWSVKPIRYSRAAGDRLKFKLFFNIDDSKTFYTSPVLDEVVIALRPNEGQILEWNPKYED